MGNFLSPPALPPFHHRHCRSAGKFAAAVFAVSVANGKRRAAPMQPLFPCNPQFRLGASGSPGLATLSNRANNVSATLSNAVAQKRMQQRHWSDEQGDIMFRGCGEPVEALNLKPIHGARLVQRAWRSVYFCICQDIREKIPYAGVPGSPRLSIHVYLPYNSLFIHHQICTSGRT